MIALIRFIIGFGAWTLGLGSLAIGDLFWFVGFCTIGLIALLSLVAKWSEPAGVPDLLPFMAVVGAKPQLQAAATAMFRLGATVLLATAIWAGLWLVVAEAADQKDLLEGAGAGLITAVALLLWSFVQSAMARLCSDRSDD